MIEQTLESGTATQFSTTDCLGTSIVVETEGGDLVGRVDEPACPDGRLRVRDDGTVGYLDGS